MTLASLINLLTIALCSAVLVQCWRMTRALQAFRDADFPSTVRAIEAATARAEAVLASLRGALRDEAEPKLAAIAEGTRLAEELGVMIGIGNATADRLLEASRGARGADSVELAA